MGLYRRDAGPVTSTTLDDWLRSPGVKHVAANPGVAAWGSIAVESSIKSPFDQPEAVAAQATRDLEFFGPARVLERVQVSGRHVQLTGKCITITADAPGYRSGANVFVVEANEQEVEGGTMLKVIRRL